MKWSIALASLIIFSQISYANILTLDLSDKSIENIKLARSASFKSDSKDTKLDFLGAGLRSKKVLVANVKVYVAQLLADNAGKFVRTNEGALKSINEMETVAFTLTFLRDVDGATVSKAFEDSFDANNVDINDQAISAFLNAVKNSGQADNGKTMTIVLRKIENNKVEISYEATNGKLTKVIGDAASFNSVASIWLGESADAGLASLKNSMIKGE
jgi:hypothetical protein